MTARKSIGELPPPGALHSAARQYPHAALRDLPGTTDETIYILGHRDGWFESATDNASDVATMVGLAEYFAKGR